MRTRRLPRKSPTELLQCLPVPIPEANSPRNIPNKSQGNTNAAGSSSMTQSHGAGELERDEAELQIRMGGSAPLLQSCPAALP